jgi:hypothetical protein
MITIKSYNWILIILLLLFSSRRVMAQQANVRLTFEKAYLHTDRDAYAMGGTLWFKAYLVNGQNNKPSVSSGNLYVELISPDSAKIVVREIIRMDNGLGHGDMTFDDSLPPGHYTLRAYTNWMRNFGDNFVFKKEITLLEVADVPAASGSSGSKQSKTKGTTASATAALNKTATSLPATNILPAVRFYPEGGSLLDGISSFVGVKAEDGYGKGMFAKGAVVSASGDTVAHFSCDSLGIGVFALLPLVGQFYHAVVDLGTRHDVFQLPSALSKGLALQVRPADTVIHALVRAAGASSSDSTISMVVKHSGKTVLSQAFHLKEDQVAFKIGTTSLPEGISSITIYNQQNKPECERLVYVHSISGSSSQLSIATDKKIYQPKEKATVTIQTQPNSNLSMAVVDASVTPVQTEDIVSYLNLQSELRGRIESPGRYFDTTNINRFKQLDQLLLTQGWRDFVWRRMADTSIRISYAAENGIPVPGRMWEEVRNKMLPNLNISLHADSAKGIKLFSARTDSAGRFHLDGLMLYGKQRIQLSATDDKGKDRGSFWLDTIRPLSVPPIIKRPAFIPNPLDSIAKANTEKKVESMKMAHIAGITRLKEVKVKDSRTSSSMNGTKLTTFGYPDQVFNITPADYQYKTLEWYVIQNIKGAQESSQPFHGVVPTGVEIPGLDTVPGDLNRLHLVLMPPQLVVNGQELYMNEQSQAEAYRIEYFKMPLNKFKKIVLKHLIGTIHGQDGVTGKSVESNGFADRFVLYLTMQDNYTQDNPGFLITEIPGYYQARTFYEPSPNAKPSIADYRSTIYWAPDIKTDANGKATASFYNAVPSTQVRVIAEGISGNGTPLSDTNVYKVE